MFCWIVRFAFYPPPRLQRTPGDYARLGFFILSGVSSFFSYEAVLSIGKMRGASLFTIAYLVAHNVPSRRVLRWLTIVLIVSFGVNVCYTIAERVWGRGIKLQGIAATSPLAAAVFKNGKVSTPSPILNGDTILTVDGRKLTDASDLAAALAASADGRPAQVKIYRVEWSPVLEVPRGKLLSGTTSEAQLGISSWSTSRDWRATGFFGHYVTYAEALQLVVALVIALFVCLPRKRSRLGLLLLLALAAFVFALLLTVTRASWIAALASGLVILLCSSSRRAIAIGGAVALALLLVGVLVLRQQRSINLFDRGDQSTTWRETVWREGFSLLVSKPRHLLVGVGMDSIKGHRREWRLFDNGRLPPGHMHSNLLQLALERGIPTLICWLVMLGVYARMLWRMSRTEASENWIERGLVLGALGGLCGFFLSGLVHYNWGDSEVVTIFYFIMGLTLGLRLQVSEEGVRYQVSGVGDKLS